VLLTNVNKIDQVKSNENQMKINLVILIIKSTVQ